MSEFKNIYLLRLLHIIHYRLSMDELTNLGLEYSQIAKLLSDLMQKGLVEDSEEKTLKLTDDGLKHFAKLKKEVYPKNSKEWIMPLEEYRIPKIGKFDVYLPKKKARD
jgi:DNA-binding PadR family transcriptional regulator